MPPEGYPHSPGQAPRDGGIDEFMRDPDRNTPYLVKFDKYTPGLSYQGHTEIALRVRGHQKEDAALLAELVTRDALSRVGIAVPALACTGLTVDGADETLYLVSEHLDDAYIEKTTGKAASESILYKALPKSQFAYRGEDPSAYATTFSQETNRKRDDLAPLIDLLRFVTEADDETYRSGISNFIDQETLTAYLAVNNILVNIDSLGGNGNNYYLLYDKENKKFTVLAWDMNESLGQFWMSPGDPATLGSSYDMESPIRHPLLERSLADPDFLARYVKKRASLADELLIKGTAFDLIDYFRTMMESTENASRNLINPDEYRTSVTWVQAFLARRKDYFATGNR
jgi:spore coat protein CotH